MRVMEEKQRKIEEEGKKQEEIQNQIKPQQLLLEQQEDILKEKSRSGFHQVKCFFCNFRA